MKVRHLLAFSMLGVALAACAPPVDPAPTTTTSTTTTSTTTTSTTLPPAPFPVGCYDNEAANTTVDVYYFGPIDTFGNAGWMPTYDGTCTGTPFATVTLVRSENLSGANAKCYALGAGYAVYQFNQAAQADYDAAPSDIWFCRN